MLHFIPMLKLATASETPTSRLDGDTYFLFGIRSEIVPLKLSLAFWVLPCKHLSSSLSLL